MSDDSMPRAEASKREHCNTDGAQETAAPAIELKGISQGLLVGSGPTKDISIRVMPGTIHGIIGENGAGNRR